MRKTINILDLDLTPTVIDTTYTDRHQVASIVADGPPPLASFTYDDNGNRLSKVLENNTTSTYVYDVSSRLTSVSHANTGGTFDTIGYTLNAVGNRTVRNQNGNADTYTLDPTDQVTGVNYAAGPTASYTYDAVGNRTSVTGAVPGAGTYAADVLNQYTSALGSTPSYDTRGNLISVGSLGSYSYDSKNRLLSATQGSNTMTVAYDYRNRPVIRTLNGTTTYLLHDGWNLIEERNSAGTLQVTYIHGPLVDELLAKTDASGTVYYHADGLGSTTALTDPTGTVVESYTYDIFGTVTVYDSNNSQLATSNHANRFAFTGREYLHEVALYDYRNRVYSADLGRFLQTDPIRFNAGDVNLYRYVSNNPVNWVDPMGEDRRIMMGGPLLLHMWIRVDIYDECGNVIGQEDLHFAPLEGFFKSAPDFHPGPAWVVQNISSSRFEDEILSNTWEEMANDPQAPRWSPLGNCWLASQIGKSIGK